jgi:CRP/FNR family transcriptional regulator
VNTPPKRIPRGTVLFRAGDPCAGFVVVHEGSIRVTLGAANGREVVLYRVTPGDVCLQTFSCLVDNRDYSAEGVAETELLAEIVPAREFQRRIASDEVFRQSIFSAVARRFSDFEDLIESVALSGLRCRLARALLRLADDHLCVEVTHEQLAREAASGRAAVSRQLAALAEEGLVSLQRGGVTILKRAELQSLARRED